MSKPVKTLLIFIFNFSFDVNISMTEILSIHKLTQRNSFRSNFSTERQESLPEEPRVYILKTTLSAAVINSWQCYSLYCITFMSLYRRNSKKLVKYVFTSLIPSL